MASGMASGPLRGPPSEPLAEQESSSGGRRPFDPLSVLGVSLSFAGSFTRNDFGRYLASILCLRLDGPESPPTALFPLPLPSFHPTAAVDLGMTRGEKYQQMIDRPLLVVVKVLFELC